MHSKGFRTSRFKSRVSPRSLEVVRSNVEEGNASSTAATIIYDNIWIHLRRAKSVRLQNDGTLKDYLARLTDMYDLPKGDRTHTNSRRPVTLAYNGLARALYEEIQTSQSKQADIGNSRYFVHKPRGRSLSLMAVDLCGDMADGLELFRSNSTLPFESQVNSNFRILFQKVINPSEGYAVPAAVSSDLEAFGERLQGFGANMLALIDSDTAT